MRHSNGGEVNYEQEAKGLADRCARIGWLVTRVNEGFRVSVPGGVPVVIHITPKSAGHYKTVLKKLNEYGLERIEQAKTDQRDQEKAERLAEERREEKRILEGMQRQNMMLLRAKYALLPHTDDLTWALTKHDTMQPPKIMEISPDVAEAMLERNTDNRPTSSRDEIDIRKSLQEGRWLLTHQAVAFDQRGVLQDGQTRLRAIVDAGVSAPMWVFTGMPVENFPVIDTGRKRTANNVLHQKGWRGQLPQRSAFARLILAHQTGSIANTYRDRFGNDQILRLWESDPDTFNASFSVGCRIGKATGFVYSAMSAAIYLIQKANGSEHRDHIDRWFGGVESGYNLAPGDARKALRDYMINNKRVKGFDNRAQLALIITAWNKTLEGEFTKAMRWARNMDFPRITTLGPNSNLG